MLAASIIRCRPSATFASLKSQRPKIIMALLHALVFVLLAVLSLTGVRCKSFNVTNSCSYTVWPGILSGAGSPAAAMDSNTTGFQLAPGESRAIPVPSGWSGRLWGRTLCSTDNTGGKFTCVTGDCGSGKQECDGGGPAPPVTLLQFTLDGGSRDMVDSYDVSLVDGFNVPVLVAPPLQGAAGGRCAPTGCVVDLNAACPAELRVTSAATGAVAACKSACQAFGSAHYCCTGEYYGNPDKCKASAYSQLFKNACPRAYTYAYDGAASTFTCAGDSTTYTVTFCPDMISTNKSSSSPNSQPAAGNVPHIDGGSQAGVASSPWQIVIIVAVLGVVAAALTALANVLALFKHCFSQGAGAAAT